MAPANFKKRYLLLINDQNSNVGKLRLRMFIRNKYIEMKKAEK